MRMLLHEHCTRLLDRSGREHAHEAPRPCTQQAGRGKGEAPGEGNRASLAEAGLPGLRHPPGRQISSGGAAPEDTPAVTAKRMASSKSMSTGSTLERGTNTVYPPTW